MDLVKAFPNDQRAFVYDLLKMGIELLTKSTIFSYYNALISHDVYIKGLFLYPNQESNQIHEFTPSFDFDNHDFDESALSSSISSKGFGEHIPLTLTMSVNHRENLYVLLAFIDAAGVLYIFQKLDDFMLVNMHESKAENKVLILYLGDHTAMLDALLAGDGRAFYPHHLSPFNKTKGSNSKICIYSKHMIGGPNTSTFKLKYPKA